MSPSLGSRWLARIGRDAVTLGRRGNVFARAAAPALIVARQPLETAADPMSAVDALVSVLAQRGARGWGDQLEVLLDDDWAYHRVIEGDFGRMKSGQRRSVAQAFFADALSTERGGWAVSTELQPDGRSLLCCAVTELLANGIRAAASTGGLRLVSLQTRLASLMNHWAGSVEADALVLVCHHDHACLALRQDDAWVALDTWSRSGAIERELRSRTAALLHRAGQPPQQLAHHAWFERSDDRSAAGAALSSTVRPLAPPLPSFIAEAA